MLTPEETLFHIVWGDGDNTFVVAEGVKEAIAKMTDGRDMVRSVTELGHLYRSIFEVGLQSQLAKVKDCPELDRDKMASILVDWKNDICEMVNSNCKTLADTPIQIATKILITCQDKEVCPEVESYERDDGDHYTTVNKPSPTCQGKARPDRGLAITGLLYELNDFEERKEPWKFIRPEIKAFYVARYQRTVTQIIALDEGK